MLLSLFSFSFSYCTIILYYSTVEVRNCHNNNSILYKKLNIILQFIEKLILLSLYNLSENNIILIYNNFKHLNSNINSKLYLVYYIDWYINKYKKILNNSSIILQPLISSLYIEKKF